jgi:hypothetical protein
MIGRLGKNVTETLSPVCARGPNIMADAAFLGVRVKILETAGRQSKHFRPLVRSVALLVHEAERGQRPHMGADRLLGGRDSVEQTVEGGRAAFGGEDEQDLQSDLGSQPKADTLSSGHFETAAGVGGKTLEIHAII